MKRGGGVKRKKRRQSSGTQCDTCMRAWCPDWMQFECAKQEVYAIAGGTRYFCPDREADYWERLSAA
jgi:hypothetical protein